jgi:hypothetical protein
MSARIAYSLKEAAEATGLSRAYLDRAIRNAQLKAKRSAAPDDQTGKSRGNYVILAAELEAFITGLADA